MDNDNNRDSRGARPQLQKSRRDRKIWGVCGGIANYFNIDSTLVRLGFLFLALGGGSGVLIYIVCALIMPEEH